MKDNNSNLGSFELADGTNPVQPTQSVQPVNTNLFDSSELGGFDVTDLEGNTYGAEQIYGDSLNQFSAKGTGDVSRYDYDFRFTYDAKQRQYERYLNQPILHSLYIANARFANSLATQVIKGITDIPDVIYNSYQLSKGTPENMAVNPISKALQDYMDYAAEQAPIYTNPYKGAWDPGSANWWLSHVDSLATAASYIIPSRAISGGVVKGLGAITKAAKAGAGLRAAEVTGSLLASVYSTTHEALGTIIETHPKLLEAARASGMSDKEAKEWAAGQASQMYRTNLLNVLPEAIGIAKMIKTPLRTRNLIGGFKERFVDDLTSEMIPEAFQEAVNLYSQKNALREADILLGKEEFGYSIMNDFLNDKEAWTAMTMGAVGGKVFQSGGTAVDSFKTTEGGVFKKLGSFGKSFITGLSPEDAKLRAEQKEINSSYNETMLAVSSVKEMAELTGDRELSAKLDNILTVNEAYKNFEKGNTESFERTLNNIIQHATETGNTELESRAKDVLKRTLDAEKIFNDTYEVYPSLEREQRKEYVTNQTEINRLKEQSKIFEDKFKEIVDRDEYGVYEVPERSREDLKEYFSLQKEVDKLTSIVESGDPKLDGESGKRKEAKQKLEELTKKKNALEKKLNSSPSSAIAMEMSKNNFEIEKIKERQNEILNPSNIKEELTPFESEIKNEFETRIARSKLGKLVDASSNEKYIQASIEEEFDPVEYSENIDFNLNEGNKEDLKNKLESESEKLNENLSTVDDQILEEGKKLVEKFNDDNLSDILTPEQKQEILDDIKTREDLDEALEEINSYLDTDEDIDEDADTDEDVDAIIPPDPSMQENLNQLITSREELEARRKRVEEAKKNINKKVERPIPNSTIDILEEKIDSLIESVEANEIRTIQQLNDYLKTYTFFKDYLKKNLKKEDSERIMNKMKVIQDKLKKAVKDLKNIEKKEKLAQDTSRQEFLDAFDAKSEKDLKEVSPVDEKTTEDNVKKAKELAKEKLSNVFGKKLLKQADTNENMSTDILSYVLTLLQLGTRVPNSVLKSFKVSMNLDELHALKDTVENYEDLKEFIRLLKEIRKNQLRNRVANSSAEGETMVKIFEAESQLDLENKPFYQQLNAIRELVAMFFNSDTKFSYLQGVAGSGKSKLVTKYVVELIKLLSKGKVKVGAYAPGANANAVISESIKGSPIKKDYFADKQAIDEMIEEIKKNKYDLIIIDEAGKLKDNQIEYLFEKLKEEGVKDTRVIFTGDPNQKTEGSGFPLLDVGSPFYGNLHLTEPLSISQRSGNYDILQVQETFLRAGGSKVEEITVNSNTASTEGVEEMTNSEFINHVKKRMNNEDGKTRLIIVDDRMSEQAKKQLRTELGLSDDIKIETVTSSQGLEADEVFIYIPYTGRKNEIKDTMLNGGYHNTANTDMYVALSRAKSYVAMHLGNEIEVTSNKLDVEKSEKSDAILKAKFERRAKEYQNELDRALGKEVKIDDEFEKERKKTEEKVTDTEKESETTSTEKVDDTEKETSPKKEEKSDTLTEEEVKIEEELVVIEEIKEEIKEDIISKEEDIKDKEDSDEDVSKEKKDLPKEKRKAEKELESLEKEKVKLLRKKKEIEDEKKKAKEKEKDVTEDKLEEINNYVESLDLDEDEKNDIKEQVKEISDEEKNDKELKELEKQEQIILAKIKEQREKSSTQTDKEVSPDIIKETNSYKKIIKSLKNKAKGQKAKDLVEKLGKEGKMPKEIKDTVKKETGVDIELSPTEEVYESYVTGEVKETRFEILKKLKPLIRKLGIVNDSRLNIDEVSEIIDSIKLSRPQKALWRLLKTSAKKLGVNVVFSSNKKDFIKNNRVGYYDINTNTAVIDITLLEGNFVSVLFHELVHAVTVHATTLVENNPKQAKEVLTKKQVSAVNDLKELLKSLQKNEKFDGTYGTTNIDELMAEITNPTFKDLLKKQVYNEEDNLFYKILDTILNILGFRVSAYGRTLRSIENIIEDTTLQQFNYVKSLSNLNTIIYENRLEISLQEQLENVRNKIAARKNHFNQKYLKVFESKKTKAPKNITEKINEYQKLVELEKEKRRRKTPQDRAKGSLTNIVKEIEESLGEGSKIEIRNEEDSRVISISDPDENVIGEIKLTGEKEKFERVELSDVDSRIGKKLLNIALAYSRSIGNQGIYIVVNKKDSEADPNTKIFNKLKNNYIKTKVISKYQLYEDINKDGDNFDIYLITDFSSSNKKANNKDIKIDNKKLKPNLQIKSDSKKVEKAKEIKMAEKIETNEDVVDTDVNPVKEEVRDSDNKGDYLENESFDEMPGQGGEDLLDPNDDFPEDKEALLGNPEPLPGSKYIFPKFRNIDIAEKNQEVKSFIVKEDSSDPNSDGFIYRRVYVVKNEAGNYIQIGVDEATLENPSDQDVNQYLLNEFSPEAVENGIDLKTFKVTQKSKLGFKFDNTNYQDLSSRMTFLKQKIANLFGVNNQQISSMIVEPIVITTKNINDIKENQLKNSNIPPDKNFFVLGRTYLRFQVKDEKGNNKYFFVPTRAKKRSKKSEEYKMLDTFINKVEEFNNEMSSMSEKESVPQFGSNETITVTPASRPGTTLEITKHRAAILVLQGNQHFFEELKNFNTPANSKEITDLLFTKKTKKVLNAPSIAKESVQYPEHIINEDSTTRSIKKEVSEDPNYPGWAIITKKNRGEFYRAVFTINHKKGTKFLSDHYVIDIPVEGNKKETRPSMRVYKNLDLNEDNTIDRRRLNNFPAQYKAYVPNLPKGLSPQQVAEHFVENANSSDYTANGPLQIFINEMSRSNKKSKFRGEGKRYDEKAKAVIFKKFYRSLYKGDADFNYLEELIKMRDEFETYFDNIKYKNTEGEFKDHEKVINQLETSVTDIIPTSLQVEEVKEDDKKEKPAPVDPEEDLNFLDSLDDFTPDDTVTDDTDEEIEPDDFFESLENELEDGEELTGEDLADEELIDENLEEELDTEIVEEETDEIKETDESFEEEVKTDKPKTETPSKKKSPLVSKPVKDLADRNGIDLTEITGTGKNGRILKKDVQNIIKNKEEEANKKVEESLDEIEKEIEREEIENGFSYISLNDRPGVTIQDVGNVKIIGESERVSNKTSNVLREPLTLDQILKDSGYFPMFDFTIDFQQRYDDGLETYRLTYKFNGGEDLDIEVKLELITLDEDGKEIKQDQGLDDLRSIYENYLKNKGYIVNGKEVFFGDLVIEKGNNNLIKEAKEVESTENVDEEYDDNFLEEMSESVDEDVNENEDLDEDLPLDEDELKSLLDDVLLDDSDDSKENSKLNEDQLKVKNEIQNLLSKKEQIINSEKQESEEAIPSDENLNVNPPLVEKETTNEEVKLIDDKIEKLKEELEKIEEKKEEVFEKNLSIEREKQEEIIPEETDKKVEKAKKVIEKNKKEVKDKIEKLTDDSLELVEKSTEPENTLDEEKISEIKSDLEKEEDKLEKLNQASDTIKVYEETGVESKKEVEEFEEKLDSISAEEKSELDNEEVKLIEATSRVRKENKEKLKEIKNPNKKADEEAEKRREKRYEEKQDKTLVTDFEYVEEVQNEDGELELVPSDSPKAIQVDSSTEEDISAVEQMSQEQKEDLTEAIDDMSEEELEQTALDNKMISRESLAKVKSELQKAGTSLKKVIKDVIKYGSNFLDKFSSRTKKLVKGLLLTLAITFSVFKGLQIGINPYNTNMDTTLSAIVQIQDGYKSLNLSQNSADLLENITNSGNVSLETVIFNIINDFQKGKYESLQYKALGQELVNHYKDIDVKLLNFDYLESRDLSKSSIELATCDAPDGCASYVMKTFAATPGINDKESRERINMVGDAWTIAGRVEQNGKQIFNIFNKPGWHILDIKGGSAEIQSKAAAHKKNQRSFEELSNYQPMEGDIIGMFYQGSTNQDKAYLGNLNYENQNVVINRYNTHVGFIRIIDGEAYVEHNVHKHIHRDKLSDVINGNSPNISIASISRPDIHISPSNVEIKSQKSEKVKITKNLPNNKLYKSWDRGQRISIQADYILNVLNREIAKDSSLTQEQKNLIIGGVYVLSGQETSFGTDIERQKENYIVNKGKTAAFSFSNMLGVGLNAPSHGIYQIQTVLLDDLGIEYNSDKELYDLEKSTLLAIEVVKKYIEGLENSKDVNTYNDLTFSQKIALISYAHNRGLENYTGKGDLENIVNRMVEGGLYNQSVYRANYLTYPGIDSDYELASSVRDESDTFKVASSSIFDKILNIVSTNKVGDASKENLSKNDLENIDKKDANFFANLEKQEVDFDLDIKGALDYVKRQFPFLDDSLIRTVPLSVLQKKYGNNVYGMYKNGIYYLGTQDGRISTEVLRHETFHLFFNRYLSYDQRNAMLAITGKSLKYKSWLKENNLNDTQENREEYLAYQYQTKVWSYNKFNNPVLQFMHNMMYKLKNIIQSAFDFFMLEESDKIINDLFRDINSGKFDNIQNDINNTRFMKDLSKSFNSNTLKAAYEGFKAASDYIRDYFYENLENGNTPLKKRHILKLDKTRSTSSDKSSMYQTKDGKVNFETVYGKLTIKINNTMLKQHPKVKEIIEALKTDGLEKALEIFDSVEHNIDKGLFYLFVLLRNVGKDRKIKLDNLTQFLFQQGDGAKAYKIASQFIELAKATEETIEDVAINLESQILENSRFDYEKSVSKRLKKHFSLLKRSRQNLEENSNRSSFISFRKVYAKTLKFLSEVENMSNYGFMQQYFKDLKDKSNDLDDIQIIEKLEEIWYFANMQNSRVDEKYKGKTKSISLDTYGERTKVVDGEIVTDENGNPVKERVKLVDSYNNKIILLGKEYNFNPKRGNYNVLLTTILRELSKKDGDLKEFLQEMSKNGLKSFDILQFINDVYTRGFYRDIVANINYDMRQAKTNPHLVSKEEYEEVVDTPAGPRSQKYKETYRMTALAVDSIKTALINSFRNSFINKIKTEKGKEDLKTLVENQLSRGSETKMVSKAFVKSYLNVKNPKYITDNIRTVLYQMLETHQSSFTGKNASVETITAAFQDSTNYINTISEELASHEEFLSAQNYIDGKNNRRYIWVVKSYIYDVISSLKNKTVPFSFRNNNKKLFYKSNIFITGLQQVLDYIDFDSIKTKDSSLPSKRLKNLSGQQYYAVKFISGFLSTANNTKNLYYQFGIRESNRTSEGAVKIRILNEGELNEALQAGADMENKIIAIKKHLLSREYKKNKKDYMSDLEVDNSFYMENFGMNFETFFKSYDSKVMHKNLTPKFLKDENLDKFIKRTKESREKGYNQFINEWNDVYKSDIKYIKSSVISFYNNNKKLMEKFLPPLNEGENYGFYTLLKAAYDVYWTQNYINGYHYDNMIFGNHNFFKNAVDHVKREQGVRSPGKPVLTGNGYAPERSKMVIYEDTERVKEATNDLKNLYRKIHGVPFEITDAATFILPETVEELQKGTGDYSLGEVIKNVAFYVDPISGKPVYIKTASFVLTPALRSMFPELDRIAKDMEKNGVKHYVPASALKSVKPIEPVKPGESIKHYHINNLYYRGYRIQSNPVSLKEKSKVSNFSQLVYFLNVNMKNFKEAMSVYKADRSLADLSFKKFNFKNKVYNQKTGKFNIDNLVKTIINTIKESDTGYRIAEIVELGKISHNFPYIAKNFIIQLSNIISKNTLEVKHVGNKLTVQPSLGVEFYEGENGLLPFNELSDEDKVRAKRFLDLPYNVKEFLKEYSREIFNNKEYNSIIKESTNYNNLSESDKELIEEVYSDENAYLLPRKLKMRTEDNYTEVIAPQWWLDQNNLKEGEYIYSDDKMKTALAVRIPTTGIHSALPIRVIASPTKTNLIIAPEELVPLHGSDFDVDALFYIRREFMKPSERIIVDELYFRRKTAAKIKFKNNPKNRRKVLKALLSSYPYGLVGYKPDSSNKNELVWDKDLENKIYSEISRLEKMDRKSWQDEYYEHLLDLAIKLEKNRKIDSLMDIVTAPKNQEDMNTPIEFTAISSDIFKNIDSDTDVNDIVNLIKKSGVPTTVMEELEKVLKNEDGEWRDPSEWLDLEALKKDEGKIVITDTEVKKVILESKIGVVAKLKVATGKINLYDDRDVYDDADNYLSHKDNFQGLSGTGIQANLMKVVSYFLYAAKMSKIDPKFKPKKTKVGEKILEESRELNLNNRTYDKLEVHTKVGNVKTMELGDTVLNGYIDNVKEQITSIINANPNTISIIGTMIAMGVDIDTITYFMQQPIVRTITSNPSGVNQKIDNILKFLNSIIEEKEMKDKDIQYLSNKVLMDNLKFGENIDNIFTSQALLKNDISTIVNNIQKEGEFYIKRSINRINSKYKLDDFKISDIISEEESLNLESIFPGIMDSFDKVEKYINKESQNLLNKYKNSNLKDKAVKDSLLEDMKNIFKIEEDKANFIDDKIISLIEKQKLEKNTLSEEQMNFYRVQKRVLEEFKKAREIAAQIEGNSKYLQILKSLPVEYHKLTETLEMDTSKELMTDLNKVPNIEIADSRAKLLKSLIEEMFTLYDPLITKYFEKVVDNYSYGLPGDMSSKRVKVEDLRKEFEAYLMTGVLDLNSDKGYIGFTNRGSLTKDPKKVVKYSTKRELEIRTLMRDISLLSNKHKDNLFVKLVQEDTGRKGEVRLRFNGGTNLDPTYELDISNAFMELPLELKQLYIKYATVVDGSQFGFTSFSKFIPALESEPGANDGLNFVSESYDKILNNIDKSVLDNFMKQFTYINRRNIKRPKGLQINEKFGYFDKLEKQDVDKLPEYIYYEDNVYKLNKKEVRYYPEGVVDSYNYLYMAEPKASNRIKLENDQIQSLIDKKELKLKNVDIDNEGGSSDNMTTGLHSVFSTDNRVNTDYLVEVKKEGKRYKITLLDNKIRQSKVSNSDPISLAKLNKTLEILKKNTGLDYSTDPTEFKKALEKTGHKGAYPAGFVYKNKVYINTTGEGSVYGADTALHEYAHLYIDHIRTSNPALYNRILKLAAKNKLYGKVKAMYPELSENDLLEEVAVSFIGTQGYREPGILAAIRNILRKLGIESFITLGDLANDLLTKNLELDKTEFETAIENINKLKESMIESGQIKIEYNELCK